MTQHENFVKENKCPYCTYGCGYFSPLRGSKTPSKGDLSFCLMCASLCTFDENMNLLKFDINSILDLGKHVRLKAYQLKMRECWDTMPEEDQKKRKQYLEILEQAELKQNQKEEKC